MSPMNYTDRLQPLIRLTIVALLFVTTIACESKQPKPTDVAPQAEVQTNQPSSSTNLSVKTTKSKKSILFFGDSLTAGFGLDEEESFPSLIQERIDSLGLPYVVTNGGLSGETTAGGKGRIDWVLKSPVDIFVLELGANDMLRGLDIKETEKNLRAILDQVKETYPEAQLIVAGMQAPPNMGKNYTSKFQSIFLELAKEYDAGLIPFLLAGLEGKGMDIGDGKHPNAEGQKVVRETVWKVLKGYL